jgi:aspartate aminotransferase
MKGGEGGGGAANGGAARRGPGLRVASRLEVLHESATLAMSQLAADLRAQGRDVVSLAAGEPDFATPPHVQDAARQAMTDGHTKYPPVAGIATLRAAIAAEVGGYTGRAVDPAEVVVSAGGKHALFNLFQALVEPGDEVVVIAPYWVSYPPQIMFAGGRAVIVETEMEDGWRLDPDRLREAITPRTRALVLNAPSNPTGAAYTLEELEPIAEVALEHDLWIVSDDIYREITFDGFAWRSIAAVAPEVARRTLVVSGTSKSYSMTGWRIGWAVAPPPLASAMARLQSQVTSGANSVAQHAALAAVAGPRAAVAEMVAAFARRRAMVLGLLREAGVACQPPRGAFYLFPDCGAASEAAGGSLALATRLMEEHGVATIPGEPFGAEGFLRLSFAASEEALRKGVARLIEGLKHIAR